MKYACLTHVLDISACHLCEILSFPLSFQVANLFVGSGADPVARENIIFGGRVGVTFEGTDARGVLEQNVISANEDAGIIIRKGSPIIKHNVIHSEKKSGIRVEGGAALIEHNVLRNCGRNGVVVFSGNPLIRTNSIYKNSLANVAFNNVGSKGRLVDNAIWGSPTSGVAILKGASPSVEANLVYGNNTFKCGDKVRTGRMV